jgi:predicted nuclease with TOPRIM domain
MEELIAKVHSQYEAEEYAEILNTITEMKSVADGLNNVIESLNAEKSELTANIEKIQKENQELKAANATLFLKANGSDASDPKQESASDDYASWIDPAEFN